MPPNAPASTHTNTHPGVHTGPPGSRPEAKSNTDPIAMLGQWGPDPYRTVPPADPLPIDRALELCHALARRRSENFSVLSSLVPTHLRDDFAAVYAFCRWADDLADETHRLPTDAGQPPTPELARDRATELLAWWRTGLDRCFQGDADHPVYIALAQTVRRHRIRPEPFHHLIDAFEQDQRVQTYATWDDLADYCRRSADPVGRIILTLAGHRPPDEDPATADLYRDSDRVCTALQLTNFWQDVRTDLLDRGRVYMPTNETELAPDDLRAMAAAPTDHAARVRFIKALRPLAVRTRALFHDARDLPNRVDPAVGPVVGLFAAGGRRVLNKVIANGCTTLWSRPRLPRHEKALLVGAALVRTRLASNRRAPAKAAVT